MDDEKEERYTPWLLGACLGGNSSGYLLRMRAMGVRLRARRGMYWLLAVAGVIAFSLFSLSSLRTAPRYGERVSVCPLLSGAVSGHLDLLAGRLPATDPELKMLLREDGSEQEPGMAAPMFRTLLQVMLYALRNGIELCRVVEVPEDICTRFTLGQRGLYQRLVSWKRAEEKVQPREMDTTMFFPNSDIKDRLEAYVPWLKSGLEVHSM